MALDTGASRTVINRDVLVYLGYDPSQATQQVAIVTGSSTGSVPVVTVQRFRCLGQVRTGFDVLCHQLPASAGIHGVVGLDFLRGLVLTIDFRQGEITVAGGEGGERYR
jgi:hypothetical protein